MSIFQQYAETLGMSNIYAGIGAKEQKEVFGWTTSYYIDRVRKYIESQPPEKVIVIVELGTFLGKSAIAVANILRDLKRNGCVICVDTWLGSPEHFTGIPKNRGYPTLYFDFLQNVVNNGHAERIIPLPLPTIQAISILRAIKCQADIVYVDAAHEYLPVYLDVAEYFGIIIPGGLMLGDDYTEHWPGVRKAANQFASEVGLPLVVHNDWVWEVAKPK